MTDTDLLFAGVKEADLLRLQEPTPPERVQWKPGRTRRDGAEISLMAYMDARHPMDTLDECVGKGYWQDRYEDVPGGRRCGIGILVNGQWVWKYDAAPDTDIEAVKGGHSDAFKRCAVKWGIGRDLYDTEEVWVPTRSWTDRNGKVHYEPAVFPQWDGSKWVIPSASPAASGPSRPQAAPAGPAAAPSSGGAEAGFDMAEVDAAQAPADPGFCAEHNVAWRVKDGDRFHKTDDGKWCRHPDNKPKGGRGG